MNEMGLLLEIYRKKLRAKIRSEIWQNIHMSLQQAYLRSNLTEKTTQIIVMAKLLLAIQLMIISQRTRESFKYTREKTTFMDLLRKKKLISHLLSNLKQFSCSSNISSQTQITLLLSHDLKQLLSCWIFGQRSPLSK